MKLKVLVGECKQEVSSFNPVASHYDDFVVSFGDEILSYHRGVRNELGGALHVFDSCEHIQVIPSLQRARHHFRGNACVRGLSANRKRVSCECKEGHLTLMLSTCRCTGPCRLRMKMTPRAFC